jgi:hypothetical protein
MGRGKRPTKAEMRATINSFLLSVDEPDRPMWADAMKPKDGDRKDRDSGPSSPSRVQGSGERSEGPAMPEPPR